MSDASQHIYKVLFYNQGQIYEVYAHNIYQSEIYGFIEIEDYIFGKKSQMVIDPAEEKLRQEFDGVQRSFIPMHAIVRIDEESMHDTERYLASADIEATRKNRGEAMRRMAAVLAARVHDMVYEVAFP